MSLESFLCIVGFHSSGIKRKVRKGKSELAQFFSSNQTSSAQYLICRTDLKLFSITKDIIIKKEVDTTEEQTQRVVE